jgi:Uma2 family endonuclease
MTPTLLKKKKRTPKEVVEFGPESNGMLMTPEEFDNADFDNDWRYELINGVVVVSPIPSESEADPNEELGYWLRNYRDSHPKGSCLDMTLQERYIRTGSNRRRADRVIWAGLGRRPNRWETPTIVAEFVSKGTRNRVRDYETKRDEYMNISVKEYWLIDRFDRCMIVFTRQGGKTKPRVIREHQIYKTPLLPGFELPLAKLLAFAVELADRGEGEDEQAQGIQA